MAKRDCLTNCTHHYIARYAKTFGADVPVAGCRVDSYCLVGQAACANYKRVPVVALSFGDACPRCGTKLNDLEDANGNVVGVYCWHCDFRQRTVEQE